MQSHECWLSTAAALRDELDVEVLLFDLYGHGRSAVPDDVEQLCVRGFADQLHSLLTHVGWDDGRRVSICAPSLGSVVAMHYALLHPDRVRRLTLLVPAGLPEPFFMPTHLARLIAKAAAAAMPHEWARRVFLLRRLLPIVTTPSYELGVQGVLRVLGAHEVRVVLAELDLVHSPHAPFWKTLLPTAGRVTLLRCTSHWWVASNLFKLKLHQQGELWLDDEEGPVVTPISDDGAHDATDSSLRQPSKISADLAAGCAARGLAGLGSNGANGGDGGLGNLQPQVIQEVPNVLKIQEVPTVHKVQEVPSIHKVQEDQPRHAGDTCRGQLHTQIGHEVTAVQPDASNARRIQGVSHARGALDSVAVATFPGTSSRRARDTLHRVRDQRATYCGVGPLVAGRYADERVRSGAHEPMRTRLLSRL